MVTRVDKKPIIYNTTLIRVWKPAVVTGQKKLLDVIIKKSRGYKTPDLTGRDIMDDYDDIDFGFRYLGIDDPAFASYFTDDELIDDESIRIARMCLNRSANMKKVFRSEAMMDDIVKIQSKLIEKVENIYYGTEAVYKLFNSCIVGNVFASSKIPNYKTWCLDTAKRVCLTQSAYMFIHPTAMNKMASDMMEDLDFKSWYAWDMFKKIETVSLKIASRRSILAHAHYAGINKKGFSPDKDVLSDFELPLTGFAEVKDTIHAHIILGMKYYTVGEDCYVLSPDDCVNLATMAQCYFRTAMYFTRSNGYQPDACDKALSLIKDISTHCCRLIDNKKNFANIIRSMHILVQGDFNDASEDAMGTDLGWKERSANYVKEANELDTMGHIFHERAIALAIDDMDKLNVGFIYHVFVGDEMLLVDLKTKVATMKQKVRDADGDEWATFIKFVKAYLLCRFMMVNKKKPKVGGDVLLLNEPWAERNISGKFTMPPMSQWGQVWIRGEYTYTQFADTWHLDAQDVSYVPKDSKGIISGKYMGDRLVHSELLMAMTQGNILDALTGSTPKTARDRICGNLPVEEVVITTAPKAENAKPSWKKRVTFAADCEFRKMQAEYDRNTRKVMGFVRGPSLAVDQCILEKQFADIADATAVGLGGAVCSHDISAWSESMDRKRKFEFEKVLTDMLDRPDMNNISNDWDKIKAVVTKQGNKDVFEINNGSFQGFDGSASTILHSMILLYCIDSARRKDIMSKDVKTNMATLIDDCIALMVNLDKKEEAIAFWAHLKGTYLKLGFEVDDLKSIFSTIKAIYLSRRFLLGGEVPSDFKVFIKAHSSYEDPLRCSVDVIPDIFGAMRGACDANGEAWYIYFCAVVSSLAELAHANNCVMMIPSSAAAIYALAPVSENGWGMPSITDWTTNDVTDKRSHFNAILESLAVHANTSAEFRAGVDVFPRPVGQAILSLKSQAWRMVSYSNIFTNPFDAIREGPLKPDMLRRNSVQDLLREVATASPWTALLDWNRSSTTEKVRELLVSSGALHAPTLAALVNCMPDNYRLSMIGKAIGSDSLLSLLPRGSKIVLKRRVHRCASNYFRYTKSIYESVKSEYSSQDFACLAYTERTKMEREEFYTANGVVMTDHTFPDPVGTFTSSATPSGSMISPNTSSLRIWDKYKRVSTKVNQLISDKGLYVPRRSGRVWEVTSEYAKGWDCVSQRVAMGLAVLARAEADGHQVDGLLTYFIKAWNELSDITPRDTHLISINGAIKRLDANPGSSTHPITVHRNTLRGFNNKLKSALDAIPVKCAELTGSKSHLHDFLAHETAMLAVTALSFSCYQFIGVADATLSFHMRSRPDCILPESEVRMTTNRVNQRINVEIMDGEDDYGLLQACPSLVAEVAIPTMKSSWVRMINALIGCDQNAVEELRSEALNSNMDELIQKLKEDEVHYTASVMIAGDPVIRGSVANITTGVLAIRPDKPDARSSGDGYTTSVMTIGSKFSRTLTAEQPAHIASAVAIRSVVWSRLKDFDITELSKILHHDPDADLDILKTCKKADFWRGVVAEVRRSAGSRLLSECLMVGFRFLGIPDIHIKANNDPVESTQSVASFFGANLEKVVLVVSDQLNAIAGRRASDFDKPLLERIITNNPTLLNSKLRKEHMTKNIAYNIKNFDSRIKAIAEDKVVHRGDKRAISIDKKSRLVELRCRRYVYIHTRVNNEGRAEFDEIGHAEHIRKCAISVGNRVGVEEENIPAAAGSFAENYAFMLRAYQAIEKYRKKEHAGVNHGWIPSAGDIGSRLAYDTIMVDSEHVASTKFAVTAAEIAPRLHKRVTIAPPAEPVVQPPAIVEYDFNFGGLEGDGDDDDFDPFDMTEEEHAAFFGATVTRLPLPAWQALYTLVYYRSYSAEKVNSKLGTEINDCPTPADMRESHLDDFSDEIIYKEFPTLFADYLDLGVLFDSEWLNRDEADAYTTDELGKGPGNYLF